MCCSASRQPSVQHATTHTCVGACVWHVHACKPIVPARYLHLCTQLSVAIIAWATCCVDSVCGPRLGNRSGGVAVVEMPCMSSGWCGGLGVRYRLLLRWTCVSRLLDVERAAAVLAGRPVCACRKHGVGFILLGTCCCSVLVCVAAGAQQVAASVCCTCYACRRLT